MVQLCCVRRRFMQIFLRLVCNIMMQQVDDPIMAIHIFGTMCFIACQWPLIRIPLEGERKEVLVEMATTQNSRHLSRNQLRKISN